MADIVNKMILQIEGEEQLIALNRELEKEREFLVKLLEIQKQGVVGVDPSTIREAGGRVADLAKQHDELEKTLRKTQSGMAGFGQATLQTGRIVQDFAQGGLPGILNNIEGLVLSLGGPTGLAGVLTAVGVAAYFAWPKLKEFFGVTEEGAEQIKKHTEALAKAREGYNELRGSSDERIKALDREREALDKTVKAEKEKLQNLEKMRAMRDPAEVKEEKERAERLEKAAGKPEVREEVIEALIQKRVPLEERAGRARALMELQERETRLKESEVQLRGTGLEFDIGPKMRDIQGQRAKLQDQMDRERLAAERTVTEALVEGKAAAAREIEGALPLEHPARPAFFRARSEEMATTKRNAAEAQLQQEAADDVGKHEERERREAEKDERERQKKDHEAMEWERKRLEGVDRRNRQEEARANKAMATRQQREAEGMVAGTAQQMGIPLTPQQITAAGQEASREIRQTGQVQISVVHAILRQFQEIRDAARQNGEMWNNLQMPMGMGAPGR